MEKKNRIVWIDYVKAILIILVVLGHATGKYNLFIYQFHVAAFFCVSGFLYRKRDNVLKGIFDKFMQLMLPLIFFFLLFTFFTFVNVKIGIYSFYGSSDYIGARNIIREFFINGNQYIDVLGATWFLSILFVVEVIHILLEQVNNKTNIGVNIIFSAIGYSLSFYLGSIGYTKHNIDIILIAFTFYELGYILRKILPLEQMESDKRIFFAGLILLLVSGVLIFYFGRVNVCTMDIVSRSYTNEYLNLVAAINGIVFVICISYLLEKKIVAIDRIASFLSNNTLGILILHFVFFRLCYVLLFWVGKIDSEDVKRLVPTYEIGCIYWPLFVIVAVSGSAIVWYLINKIKPIKICLGQDKNFNDHLWNKLTNSRLINYIFDLKKANIIKLKNDGKLLQKNKRKLAVVLVSLIYVIIISIPIIKSGIMCNDELQTRYWGMRGAKELFTHYAQVSIAQGRVLSIIPVSINFFIQFGFKAKVWKGLISIIVLLTNCFLILKLINKLFDNDRLTFIYFIIYWSCMAVNFEHTLPNTFVAFLGIPISVFISSLLIMIGYFETKEKKKLTIAMVMLFISLCSYEGILTLMPLYLIIAFIYRDKKEGIIKGTYNNVLCPVLISFSYLILYLITGEIFKSSYSGNKLTFVSLPQTLEIIKNLILSGIPGYYSYISPKYHCLRWVYSGNERSSLYLNIVNIRVILIAVVFVLMGYIIKQGSKKKSSVGKCIMTLLVVGCLTVIVTIPISLSEMYQNNVGEKVFIGLPTSYLVYLFIVFMVSYFLSYIINAFSTRNIMPVIIFAIFVFISQIQFDNDIFASRNAENYSWINNIERLLDNDVMNYLDGKNMDCAELYQTHDALGIHDGYWTDYMSLLGHNIVLENSQSCEEYEIRMVGNEAMCIIGNNQGWYISKNNKMQNVVIEKKDDEKLIVECTNEYRDNGKFIYSFIFDADGNVENIDYAESIQLLQNEM